MLQKVIYSIRKYDFPFQHITYKENMSFGSTQGPVPTMEGTGTEPPGRFAPEGQGGLGPNIYIKQINTYMNTHIKSIDKYIDEMVKRSG